jgi:hypothetical protein
MIVVEYSDFKREVNDIVFDLKDDVGKGSCIWEPLGRGSRLFDKKEATTPLISLYDELRKNYVP